MRLRHTFAFALTACAVTTRPMALRKVTLYQNGIGYFERAGHLGGNTLHLAFSRAELDDVLKTLTVIDNRGGAVATVDVPTVRDSDRSIGLGVRLGAGRVHDVAVSYAVPTPTWKAAYRVVLDDTSGERPTRSAAAGGAEVDDKAGLLQAWAMVNNQTEEDWGSVQLTLATGAPMSYALDLHTPQYAKRPDATGHLVAPTVLGPVDDEHALGPDRDRDGIPDARDKCPDEPEVNNGFQDEDGCPDRGRVVVTDSAMEVLERIMFPKGAAEPKPEANSILDAVAATLRAHPDITRIEIGGNASSDETDPWGLSAKRGAEVRAALLQRGITADRLVVVPYGATRPIDSAESDASREKNRRIDFLIVARTGDSPPTALDPRSVAASVRTNVKPDDVAGSVRYVVTEPVSIRHGASTMVSILNAPVNAEDAMLFRPDGNAPGSDRHPFRAVKLANTTGYTLEPGPVAIFARGTFVGDTLLKRLELGETAWIPYALDGGTTVTTTGADDDHPVGILAVQRGVLTVEDTDVRTTTYAIIAGRESAKTLYIRHAKASGYTATELPPGTQDRGDSYLVPVPLRAGKPSTLAIEERQARHREIKLLDAKASELALYIEGSRLAPGVADKLRAAIELRREMAAREDSLGTLRTRMGDTSARASDLRESLRTIEKAGGAGDLRKQLLASLTQVTNDFDATARELAATNEALAVARGKLAEAIGGLQIGP